MLDIANGTYKGENSTAVLKAKVYYDVCMNASLQEELGNEPMLTVRPSQCKPRPSPLLNFFPPISICLCTNWSQKVLVHCNILHDNQIVHFSSSKQAPTMTTSKVQSHTLHEQKKWVPGVVLVRCCQRWGHGHWQMQTGRTVSGVWTAPWPSPMATESHPSSTYTSVQMTKTATGRWSV